ncbi:hypothetical protein [Pontibacter rugosus]|uniref:Uncharacterized protein n=1 Tax=Pontibacter rugosus TaxID=1745966 RepID=A0ABW3SWE4_9BACT
MSRNIAAPKAVAIVAPMPGPPVSKAFCGYHFRSIVFIAGAIARTGHDLSLQKWLKLRQQ